MRVSEDGELEVLLQQDLCQGQEEAANNKCLMIYDIQYVEN